MHLINPDIDRRYKSAGLIAGNKVIEWVISVSTRIKFTAEEMQQLEDNNLDELTAPFIYEKFADEIEIYNSELVEDGPEKLIQGKFEDLKKELDNKTEQIIDTLIEEYEFEFNE